MNKHVSVSVFNLLYSIYRELIDFRFSQIRSVHQNIAEHICKYCDETCSFRDGLDRHIQLLHTVSYKIKFHIVRREKLSVSDLF